MIAISNRHTVLSLSQNDIASALNIDVSCLTPESETILNSGYRHLDHILLCLR